jgi:hypothetical protein
MQPNEPLQAQLCIYFDVILSESSYINVLVNLLNYKSLKQLDVIIILLVLVTS